MIRGSHTPINYFHRILDIGLLVAISYAVEGWLIPQELARVLVVFCGALTIVVFSFFSVYRSWRETGLVRQLRMMAFAWFSVLVLFNFIIFLLSSKEHSSSLLKVCSS